MYSPPVDHLLDRPSIDLRTRITGIRPGELDSMVSSWKFAVAFVIKRFAYNECKAKTSWKIQCKEYFGKTNFNF